MFQWVEAMQVNCSEKRAEARARVSDDEGIFEDHFPTKPILPGSIVIELAAQVSGPLAEAVTDAERYAILGIVRSAKFIEPIYLPMQASVIARVIRQDQSSVTTHCTVLVGHQRVATAELTMTLVEPTAEWSAAVASRRERVAGWKQAWCTTS